jgi:hypothetical protein
VSYGTVQLHFSGSPYNDMGMVKYDVAGNAVWGANYGTIFRIVEHNLTVDPAGNIYRVWGITYSALNIRKMNPNGVEQWTISGGGSYSTSCGDIKVNSSGEVFMTGSFWPGGTFGTYSFENGSNGSMYTAKISPDGNFKWVLTAVSADEPTGAASEAIAVSASGSTYIAGHISGGSGIVYFGMQPVNMANGNVFFTKISEQQLIFANEPWKYLDNGSNQGTAWRPMSFDDSGWATGNAELGYGDGDEATVVSYGGNASNKYVTTYFRKRFFAGDLNSFSALEISLLRDDGAVVYINGTEVMRSNMPSGSITYTTLAPGFGSLPEGVYDVATVSKDALVEGYNEIAVEVHQESRTSSDVSFNLKMRKVNTTVPNNELISANSGWTYSDWGGNLGTAWKEPGYDDQVWRTGNAELGYGDGGENTVVSYGSNASNKYITTYFRKTFSVADTSAFTGLELQMIRDDGAVVYINGTEVYRNNMPTGTIAYNTLASVTVDGSAESAWITASLPKTSLHNGSNLIAVEIHQRSASSSDISFNLKLRTTTTPVPEPELISAGSSWKYLDNGSNQGTAWRGASFSDATWSTGNAELGYGDGGEATVVSYGGNASNKYITTYFRKTFNVTNASAITALELSLVRDDGAVVYINGTEVYRNNMPTGTIYYNTLAPSYIDGANESAWTVANISSSALVNGANVIAVEIHQNSPTSSDISFNLKLKALSSGRVEDPQPQEVSDTLYTIAGKGDMLVYPNPSTGTFTLEFCLNDIQEQSLTIEIMNAVGQVVYSKRPEISNRCVKEVIELEKGLPSGVYLLNVISDTRKETKQIVLTNR